MVDEFDPDLVFVNLGDIDRVGHSDLTGTTLKAARTAALASTDLQVGRFVDMLKNTGRWDDLGAHRPRRPLDGLVAARTDGQPHLGLRRRPSAGRQRRRSPRTAAPTSLYWTGAAADRDSRAGPDARGRRAGDGGRLSAHSVDRRLAAARPGGRRPGRLLQGGLAVQRPGARRATRSPATTATRPPSRSRSSSRAARDAWPSARCAPMWRTPSTSRRRSGSCSGSLRPRAATTGPPASSRFVEPVPAEARFSGERHPTGTR